MNNNRSQPNRSASSHTEAALADYLQDLLLPQQQEIPPPVQQVQWAEPPVLDPRVFRVAPAAAEPEVVVTRAPTKPELETEPVRTVKPLVAKATVSAPAPAPAPAPAAARVTTPLAIDVATIVPRVAKAPEPLTPAEVKPAAVPEVRQNRWVDGRPEWAQNPFDCLLFSVGGLKLAVPLVLLGAVHPLDTELTPLFGRPKWFMGLLTRNERNVRVVDTAQWVMPDRYRSDGQSSYGFVIRLDNSEWGLACDEVAQSFRLKPEQVKWRSEDSRRPWLAGTVKSQMCALLDVGRFARMLEQAEKTRKFDLQA
ncbi:chemotaxis protein CheW [Hydrocarboniclastica marina]|uniref:Chemotaxis protein CheW n=1 Tax=Hydrocarboniclastica marina TaxID=2259620 RepID=A0A4P7XIJ5_9ALTE|nr:chemotaxis protein CheW [Hydrocarboniclastica marina]QCF25697.1 chemotaxis protein CheW [Hydrocarboniclastica marina]